MDIVASSVYLEHIKLIKTIEVDVISQGRSVEEKDKGIVERGQRTLENVMSGRDGIPTQELNNATIKILIIV